MTIEKVAYIDMHRVALEKLMNEFEVIEKASDGYGTDECWIEANEPTVKELIKSGYLREDEGDHILKNEVDTILFYL